MFGTWLTHRMEAVGLEDLRDLARRSGLSVEVLADIFTIETFDMLERSEKRSLAAALRLPLKRLLALEDGDFSPYQRFYDADTGARRPYGRSSAEWNALHRVSPYDRGTPLVGDVQADGEVDLYEDWHPAYGPAIPVRAGNGRETYALRIRDAEWAVFRNTPIWELRLGEPSAIYVTRDFDGLGYFARPYGRAAGRLKLVFDNQESIEVEYEWIARVGRLVGRYQPEDERQITGELQAVPKPTADEGPLLVIDEFVQEFPDYESNN